MTRFLDWLMDRPIEVQQIICGLAGALFALAVGVAIVVIVSAVS